MTIAIGLLFYKEHPSVDEFTDQFILDQLGYFDETEGQQIKADKLQIYKVRQVDDLFHLFLVRLEDQYISIKGYFPIVMFGFEDLHLKMSEIELRRFKNGLFDVTEDVIRKMLNGKAHDINTSSATYTTGQTVMTLTCDATGILDAMIDANRNDIKLVK